MKDENPVSQNAPISLRNDEESNEQNVMFNSQKNEDVIKSTGRIGSDGSVLLLEVGRLEANGKSLNQLRSEVRNILIAMALTHNFN